MDFLPCGDYVKFNFVVFKKYVIMPSVEVIAVKVVSVLVSTFNRYFSYFYSNFSFYRSYGVFLFKNKEYLLG